MIFVAGKLNNDHKTAIENFVLWPLAMDTAAGLGESWPIRGLIGTSNEYAN